jgi:hypothetical protein
MEKRPALKRSSARSTRCWFLSGCHSSANLRYAFFSSVGVASRSCSSTS